MHIRRTGRGEGVNGIHTAPILDSKTSFIAKENRFLTDVASIKSAITANSNTGYYNDVAKVAKITEAETVITVEGRDIPPALMAMMLGKTYNPATGMLYDDGTQTLAPYFATSFFRVYEDAVKFEQYLKGKWSIEGEESVTKKEDIDPKNVNLIYTAITTEYQWDISLSGGAVYDFDTDAFKALPSGSMRYQKVITKTVSIDEFKADPDGWYNHVQVPAPLEKPVLTLSSSIPANLATNVAVDASIDFTFSNPLSRATVIVVDDSFNAVAGAVIWSADAKKLTFIPSDDYASAETYIGAYDCIDTYGQRLQGAIQFTTA